jgi:hypothetical protein
MESSTRAPDTTPTDAAPAAPPRRSKRLYLIGGLVAFVAVVAFVLYWFQPQKLFIDDEVFEDLPEVVALDDVAGSGDRDTAATGTPDEPSPATATNPLDVAGAEAARLGTPVAVTSGEFTSLDHPTSGTALLVVQPDGSRLVRFEGLRTDNGPDLRVVLSTAEVGAGDYGSLIELGRLKGNIGDQNYDVPPDLDLSTVRSVVVWCERFTSAFGEAPLVI